MGLFGKLKEKFTQKKTPQQSTKAATISPELRQMIALSRQQFPQLSNLSDEQMAEIMIQANQKMKKLQEEPPVNKEELGNMTPEDLGMLGAHMQEMGRWDEAEKYFFLAMEKAERMNNIRVQAVSTGSLATICRLRGDFLQGLTLAQKDLALVERLGDQFSMGFIYNEIGENYRMQGSYPQAIEYFKKSLSIMEQFGTEVGYEGGLRVYP